MHCRYSQTPAAAQLAKNYTNCQVVSYDNNIKLYWTLVNSTHINLAFSGNASAGWLSVGLCNDGTMNNKARLGGYR